MPSPRYQIDLFALSLSCLSRVPVHSVICRVLPTMLLLLLAISLSLGDATADPTKKKLKFLAYSPQFANSHVNFIGKISDTLVDAGHEVLPQTPHAKEVQDNYHKTQMNMWETHNGYTMVLDWIDMIDSWADTCRGTINTPGLIENLRAEKFDVGYAESIDFCAFGLFHLVGIKNVAITQSIAMIDGNYNFMNVPSMPSYVPTMIAGFHGDRMSFFQRMANVIPIVLMDHYVATKTPAMEKVFKQFDASFPSLNGVMGNISLVFLNSEPLVDFPRLTTHKIVEIGGIVNQGERRPLNKTWSDILELRPKTVLLSFGTFVKAYMMPSEYKTTIRETLKKFPDVTFIWKYEHPEDNVSGGAANIIETTWVPQVDMLHDPRLSAFMTHCGQGSITEANFAGVPLIAIPVFGDQLRNAHQAVRSGVSVMVHKTSLDTMGPLEEAIREVLYNDEYMANAIRLKALLADRPFAMKDIFVRNIEFLARYGPLRQLDHAGKDLNFFQFYLIDVFAFVVSLVLSALFVVVFALRCLCRFATRRFRKSKIE